MQRSIKDQILRECDKLIQRHNMRISQRKKNERRYAKRTGLTPGTPANYEPNHWVLNPHFNPFYVRAKADSIAHSISQKIRNREYAPHPALCLPIPKPAGGSRNITIFPIPDAAVSNLLFHSLRGRNQQFFSSYAYAYRGDRSVHHAVQHLYRYVKGTARVFALNYDFSKYFDSIDHEYLRRKLHSDFRLSGKESGALESFLSYRKAERQDYALGHFVINDRGVPQGSSVSLFLANVACLDLDIGLEREGAVFARYADDTIILCSSYEMAHRCANRMLAHGTRSRTEINFAKSEGIFLITREPRGEMRASRHFDFLGNRISQTSVTVAPRSVRRIKGRIFGHHPSPSSQLSEEVSFLGVTNRPKFLGLGHGDMHQRDSPIPLRLDHRGRCDGGITEPGGTSQKDAKPFELLSICRRSDSLPSTGWLACRRYYARSNPTETTHSAYRANLPPIF